MPTAGWGAIACGLVVLGVATVIGISRAEAQNNNMLNRPQVLAPEKNESKPEQPPAVPGARAESEPAPAERPPSDMPPTEALFDAINRGDIATARDAIGRGADLDGQNILGLTPLELSVDIGRKDITFMLLSLRAGKSISGPAPTSTAAARPLTPAKPGAREIKVAAVKPKTAPPAHAPGGMQSTVAAMAPARPQLFAGDGGTPVPSAGFLGFGTVTR
jgi:hypothetical protein